MPKKESTTCQNNTSRDPEKRAVLLRITNLLKLLLVFLAKNDCIYMDIVKL